MTEDEKVLLKNATLEKWCPYVIEGEKISKELAEEILIRTDDFYFGNNRELNALIRKFLGVKNCEEWFPYEEMQGVFERIKSLRNDIHYFSNQPFESTFWQGPYGWVDWQGNVGSCTHNAGKWPNAEEIYNEWKLIAETWPTLILTVRVYRSEFNDGETHENQLPQIQLDVKDGVVKVVEPTMIKDINQIYSGLMLLPDEKGCLISPSHDIWSVEKSRPFGCGKDALQWLECFERVEQKMKEQK